VLWFNLSDELEENACLRHGIVDQELLARDEYLVTENESCATRFRDEFGSLIPNASAWLWPPKDWTQSAGRGGANRATGNDSWWQRRLIAKKFDGSKNRSGGKGGSTRDVFAFSRWL